MLQSKGINYLLFSNSDIHFNMLTCSRRGGFSPELEVKAASHRKDFSDPTNVKEICLHQVTYLLGKCPSYSS